VIIERLTFDCRFFATVRLALTSFSGIFFVDFMLWIAFSLAMVVLAGLVVQFVGPFSAGSGIPAMKSILSGVMLRHYLSFRTLLSKAVGIVCAYAAGLFVGKEGPYVHMCSAIAYQLSRLPIFKRIKKNEALTFQMIGS
jgi:chloride channel 2